MRYSHNTSQTSFLDMGIMQVEIPSDDPLMKVHRELDWDRMVELVEQEYSQNMGRPSKSIRMMLGLEIAKHILRETDKSIMQRLRTDMALQVFCGFSSYCTDIPDPSTLTVFRRRLSQETLRMLEAVNLRKFQKKLPQRKRHQIIADSTCFPANITLPFDSKVLASVWRFLVRELEKVRKNGGSLLIRGKRSTRKALDAFRRTRQKTSARIIAIRSLLLREGKKLLQKLQEELRRRRASLGRRQQRMLAAARLALRQQEEMLRKGTQKIKDRIVSLHEPLVRPIPRGKEAKRTEFGTKVSFSCIGGTLLQTARTDNNPFSDTTMVEDAMEAHERTFGRKPSELSADRGAHSPENHHRLAQEDITDGIQWKGKPPPGAHLSPTATRKRTSRQRSGIEARIGIWKNRYGGHRNTYREAQAHVRITFGLLGMNALAIAG